MLSTKQWKLFIIIALAGILSVTMIPQVAPGYTSFFLAQPIDSSGQVQPDLDQPIPDNETIPTYDEQNITNTLNNTSPSPPAPTPLPTPKPTIKPASIASNPVPVMSYVEITTPTPEPPTPEPTTLPSDSSKELQAAINALGPSGGEVIIQSDTSLSSTDIQVTSNIVLSGANPGTTIYLQTKRLNVAKNAVNVTIRNLILDAADLGERNVIAINPGAENITIKEISINNHTNPNHGIVSLGKNILLKDITFRNVQNAYPIYISGNRTFVSNCYSSDQSVKALVSIAGGISDIHIVGNQAINRPLFGGGSTTNSSTGIWIENNTLTNFPALTYGILVMGGTPEPLRAPYNKVYVLGNNIKAGIATYNAIAIYGLSTNVIVANNTVDQTLSGHNAIGVSSGINVTVTQNTVFGSRGGIEGGIEVESNPVHNRFIGISENVTVTNNIVYGSQWGIYVRIMVPDHINWEGQTLRSRNILIQNNTVSTCTVGINLLAGENIVVKENTLTANTTPLKVDETNVLNYSIENNIGYPQTSP